jgi:hypothetical protein
MIQLDSHLLPSNNVEDTQYSDENGLDLLSTLGILRPENTFVDREMPLNPRGRVSYQQQSPGCHRA